MKYKKIIKIAVILIYIAISELVLCNSVDVKAKAEDYDEVIYKTERQLYELLNIDNNINLSNDIDLSNLYMSDIIPTYEYIDNKFILTEWKLYPIVNDKNQLKAFSMIDYCGQEVVSAVTTQYVDKIEQSYNNGCSIKLVYDRTKLYLVTGAYTEILSEYPEINNRDELHNVSDLRDFYDSNSISESEYKCDRVKLKLESNEVNYIGTSKYLNVRIEKQYVNGKYYPICWACAAASMGNYITKTISYSGYEFAQKTYGVNAGRTDNEVASALNLLYDTANSFYVVSSAWTFRDIIAYIDAGYPLYGLFKYQNDDTYHSVLIRGYNLSNSTFSVMDPLTENSYGTGSVLLSGELKYNRLANGTTLVNVSGVRYGATVIYN